MRSSAVIFILVTFAFACDRASSIKPPGKNYFVKYFGGDGNQTAVKLIVNSDGTFYILGSSRIAADSLQKIYLAKADAEGNLMWEKVYGDAEMEARDFLVTSGAIVVAANRSSSKGASDKKIQLVKFDPSNGNPGISSVLLFTQQPSANTIANSITILNNGDFLVCGNTDYQDASHMNTQNALHFRTDNSFVQQVNSWLDIDGAGTINNVVNAFPNADSIIYLFGSTNASYTTPSATDQNFWTFRLHNSTGANDGNSDEASFVDSRYQDLVTNVQKASTGGYLMTGVSIDNAQNQLLKVVKLANDDLALDSTDIQFRYWGPSLGKGSVPYSTGCNSALGNYLILANSYNFGGNSDMMLMKLYSDYSSKTLRESWKNPVILGGDGDDRAATVAELPDGHIVILGTMNLGKPAEQDKIVLIKLNSSGGLRE